ncbi:MULTISPECIES: PAAR domain-containing protein [unclassified Coleofasciculus]|uniref:PAAR domain-containing protein n=1 Tax=Cyanophyceae TaxID=3028117 RepID=UPI0016898F19|nr:MULTISPECIES: PAAR domain-containing protein [unclassified Coleofasciculus]MBD1880843.1 PAAR domain-containing protein [Coleofasciculus sp. FACHB-T130]MBD2541328.1 PAAR domain-containing protein [Coleofasciculus sp. FACHB-SPT36]
MLPVAVLGDVASGSPIIGPGAPTVLVMGRPIACLGDAVTGPSIAGALAMPCSVTVLACGRPVAHMGTMTVGATPTVPPVPISLPVIATGVTVLVAP